MMPESPRCHEFEWDKDIFGDGALFYRGGMEQ